MIDQDSNTTASCQLLNTSNDRVQLVLMTLVVGPTATDYESLDSSKTLWILIKCEDQHGAAVESWICLPVKGNISGARVIGSFEINVGTSPMSQ